MNFFYSVTDDDVSMSKTKTQKRRPKTEDPVVQKVYNTVQMKLISRETKAYCNNCNDYAFLRQCNTANVT